MANEITDEQLADYFRKLEDGMRDIGAMVEVIMSIWRDSDLDRERHHNQMTVVLESLELRTQGFVDDYRAKLESWSAK
jgi:hypothetical protein